MPLRRTWLCSVALLWSCSAANIGPAAPGDTEPASPGDDGGDTSAASAETPSDARRPNEDSGSAASDAAPPEVAPPDASSPDAPPPPAEDPVCALQTGTVTFGATIPRSAAEPMPFGYRTLINGQRPSGNVVDDGQQWFSFTVDAPRDVEVEFAGGNKLSANFYFASETTPQVSLGGPVTSRTLHAVSGTYYVEITDGLWQAQGFSWNVSMRWTVPPAGCAGF